jgi:hypothetical protein
MQWVQSDSEPTIDELGQLKYVWEIEPGGEHIFSAFFSNLSSPKSVRIAPDWLIGSRSSNASGGTHTFKLDGHEGFCRIKMEVYDDFYKITPENTLYCYKKLIPVRGRMVVITEEKTIFNDYGVSTDKIEKQIIRLK